MCGAKYLRKGVTNEEEFFAPLFFYKKMLLSVPETLDP